ncbi:potassium channel family protein [Planococcus lenghuensis]|uniref:RCK N-terminal domain-containing protein n=1 Tax=Planococcus lenghuensis TaxID=2213202 RepID=A0A1Q2L2X8_9BACL|nr:potassium channel family protein [Planococcus lenghuensis]AQQ54779.1 hypothetical protein B0X71_17835 [Planococcus lenghuensis]
MFELMKKVVQINTGRLVLFTAAFYTASAFIIYFLEPRIFLNPFIGFWWVMTTVTTTGFGDYSPVTVPGMLFAIFLYIFGIGLIGVIIGKVVDAYSIFRRRRMEGKLNYKGKNHYVIVGWSQKARKTVEEILLIKHTQVDVVLIDLQKETPFEHERFHFIQGNPTEPAVLQQASVKEAKSVSIFAPDNQDEVLADGKTLLIASAIEKFSVDQQRSIYTIAEIVHENHIPMFEHARVDELVLSNEAFPHLMAKTLLHHGSSQLFMQLLSENHGDNLWEIKPSPSWKTYREAQEALARQGANLVADRNDFSIIRRLDEEIPVNARLYIICDPETFEKLQLD